MFIRLLPLFQRILSTDFTQHWYPKQQNFTESSESQARRHKKAFFYNGVLIFNKLPTEVRAEKYYNIFSYSQKSKIYMAIICSDNEKTIKRS